MSDYVCGACSARIPDHTLRATPTHPDGEVTCPQCRTRLAVARPAAKRQVLHAVVIGLLVFTSAWLFSGNPHGKLLAAIGWAVLALFASRSHAASRKLVPQDPTPTA
ncbi:TMEM14 family protein [Luteimonas sp. e5]